MSYIGNPSVGTNLTTAPGADTLCGAVYNSSAPTPSSGQLVALQADSTGNLKVSGVPATAGGLSAARYISAASTNLNQIKGSAGQLYNVQAFNANATTARFLRMYNSLSASVTVGTTTQVAVWMIPANSSGFVIEISNGLAFSTAMSFAITGLIGDSDTTAIGANEVLVNFQYK